MSDDVKVTQEMLDAYVAWDPPVQFDAGNPVRALGLIRAAYFAGWIASNTRTAANADVDRLVEAGAALAHAEAEYRLKHDTMGDGHIEAGRAWDRMREAGKRMTAALANFGERP